MPNLLRNVQRTSLRRALFLLSCWGLGACGSSEQAATDAGPTGDVTDARPDAPDSGVELPTEVCEIVLDCNQQTILDEPKIPCQLRVEDGRGGVEYDGAAFVEKRGRSSLTFPKAQYAVELRTALDSEESNATSLLGMGKEDDWILNGAHIDRSLMRNKFFYEIFQSFGAKERYAPETAFCELTLDGEYEGVYLLGERIERDDDRLDIVADTTNNGSSFIVKQDVTDSPGSVRPVGMANGAWQLVYPKKDVASPAQQNAIATLFGAWQDFVVARDPELFSIVDIDSAVDFVLLEELAKNNDAYFLSMHLWREAGGLVHFSLWDLDLSIGQPEYNDSLAPERWIQARPPMICRMANMAPFRKKLPVRWQELRAGVLSESAINQRIDSYLAILGDHPQDNFIRWPIEDITFNAHILYPVTSYAEEIAHVRQWLTQRLQWMDNNIAIYHEDCTT